MLPDLSSYTITTRDTVLLVIDIQERLAPAIDGNAQIVERAAALVQIAGLMGLPILVTEQYPRGLGPTVAPLRELLATVPGVSGTYEKLAFNALTPEVQAALAATGRRTVIITGMETHVCVFQTVRSLLAAGYKVFIAMDAVGSRTEANKQNGLQLMAAMGAVVSNLETILFDLLQVAGTPLFKQLSKLIK
jgi:nicotinamidase-related amidase